MPNELKLNRLSKRIEIHFSQRKPKDEKGVLYTSVLAYSSGNRLVLPKEVKRRDFRGDMTDTYIEGYRAALEFISEHQHELMAKGYSQVVLCTDNKILISWLTSQDAVGKTNQRYLHRIAKAGLEFAYGGKREIKLDIYVQEEAVGYSRAYKYCYEQYLTTFDPESLK